MDEYEDRKSRFNAGVALAERLDALQRAINAARYNPLMVNPETGTYNYENIYSSFHSLTDEAWGKLSDGEKQHCLRLLNVAEQYKKVCPPIKLDKNGTTKINAKNFEQYMNFLNHAVRKAKEFLDRHNFNAPDSDGDDEGY